MAAPADDGLRPDIVTVGKAIGGGVPGAAYGFSAKVAKALASRIPVADCDTGGIGGTLAGNCALAGGDARDAGAGAYAERVTGGPSRWRTGSAPGVETVIAEFALPWIVKQLGCRAEYWFRPAPPRNGGEAAAAVDVELDRYMHLAALNRGILLTPFHNMALIAPTVTESDIDRHTAVFRESVEALVG